MILSHGVRSCCFRGLSPIPPLSFSCGFGRSLSFFSFSSLSSPSYFRPVSNLVIVKAVVRPLMVSGLLTTISVRRSVLFFSPERSRSFEVGYVGVVGFNTSSFAFFFVSTEIIFYEIQVSDSCERNC